MTLLGSSGDLAADRRYQWALGALEAKDFEAARDLFAQTLDLAPDWTPGVFGLAQALEALGRRDEAIIAYRRALTLDRADGCGASLRLAHLSGEAVAAAPRAYVTSLFDQYAAKFDRHLVEALAYRGPEILEAAIFRAEPGKKFAHLLDLGCGAGLFGAQFRARVDAMTGVDLSPAMIFQARTKNLYERLIAADIAEFLATEPAGGADLAVAADVFVYIGDLDPIFRAVARALVPGGLFAFTAQAREGDGFLVGEDMRYAHGGDYLRNCAHRNAFAIVDILAVSTRKDRGVDVPGWSVVLRKA